MRRFDFGIKTKGGDCGKEAVASPAQIYGAHLAAEQIVYGRFHSKRHGERAGQVVARAAGQQPQGRVRVGEGRKRLADGAVAAADHEPLSALGHGLLRQLGCVALGPRVAQFDRLPGALYSQGGLLGDPAGAGVARRWIGYQDPVFGHSLGCPMSGLARRLIVQKITSKHG